MSTRFTVEWLPESADRLILAAKVWAEATERPLATFLEYKERRHVGDIHFNGNEWMFIRIDQTGEQVMDGFHYIPVDPDQEAAFRNEHAHIAVSGDGVGASMAQLAELNVRRRLHRDSSLELAEIGGKMEAKKWWRNGYFGRHCVTTGRPEADCTCEDCLSEVCDTCGEERRAKIHTDTELHPDDRIDGLSLHPFSPMRSV